VLYGLWWVMLFLLAKEIFIVRKVIQKYHRLWNQDLQQEAWLSYYSQPHYTTKSVISSCRRQRYLVDLDENSLKKQDDDLAYRPFRWTFRREQKVRHHHHRSIGHADALHVLRVDEDWKP
jgi:hypothetical protein